VILPFEAHSPYSILEGYANIQTLIAKSVELNLPAVCLTDTNSLSGAVEFLQSVEKINKNRENKILPIIGITRHSESIGKYILLARNKDGYHQILRLLSLHEHVIPTDSENLVVILTNPNQRAFFTDPNGHYYLHDEFNVYQSDIPKLTYTPCFYIEKEDRLIHRVLLCIKHQCTLNNNNIPENEWCFFNDMHYYNFVTKNDECKVQKEILNLISPYTLAKAPQLPVISSDPDNELTALCREGWIKRKLPDKVKNNPTLKEIYVGRIKKELTVFKEAKLSNYLLIVNDIMGFVRKAGRSCGLRGSAAGCVVSYLIGVSGVDPLIPDPTLEYSLDRELLFERFYNKGRNSGNNISLPDCDMDVPISCREDIIQYIKRKYGPEKVGYIVTFSRLDGKGAIKEAFRVLEPTSHSFETANEITKMMVDTSKVQDVLADIQETQPDYTIIQFNIDNNNAIKQYYEDYKDVFEVAIKLSSVIKNTGRHAAGIVIANVPLHEFLPVKYDEHSGEQIVAYEMSDLEYAGGVKFDILGVAAYEKIDCICNMVNKGLKTI
jgi:DNA polymerase III alpha subunit